MIKKQKEEEKMEMEVDEEESENEVDEEEDEADEENEVDEDENEVAMEENKVQKDKKKLRKSGANVEEKTSKKEGKLLKKEKKSVVKEGKQKIQGDINAAPGEKPDWSSIKKEKKKLLLIRKTHDCTNYELTVNAKRIWEQVRRSDCPAEKRTSLTAELHKLLAGKMKSVIFSHDMARIVQWLLKLGSNEVRQAIFDELSKDVKVMIISKYASTCVKRMLKYGDGKMRNTLINALSGSTVKLTNNVISSPIIELIYTTWATPEQKLRMKAEMYGNFPQITKAKSLFEAISLNPEMKEAILRKVKVNLNKFLKKEKVLSSTLVQKVLLEFLETTNKKDQEELLESLSSIPIMNTIHLKDGAKVWMIVIWHASKKVKKLIIKQLKGNVREVAISEYGHLVLLALFDYVDDTVIVSKVLIKELLDSAADIAANEYGRKVILYLVAHRDLSYFTPELVKLMEKGDEIADIKKKKEVRKSELLGSISKPLLGLIKENVSYWLGNHSIAMVTLAILKSGSDPELSLAFKALAEYFVDESSTMMDENEKEILAIEDLGVHMMLKKLIQHDSALPESSTFSKIIVDHLSSGILKRWVELNRGCFLLICILESKIPSAIKSLKEKLQKSLILDKISKSSSKGATILKKKLNAT